MELVLFTQPPIMAKPGKGALHNPTMGQHLKALHLVTLFHDIEHPSIVLVHPRHQGAGIPAIGTNATDSRQPAPGDGPQHESGTITILHVGLVAHDCPDQPEGVDQDMPFPPVDAFARIVAARPPFCVVFTDWLSRINALGVQLRPTCWRTSLRKVACTRSHVPSSQGTPKSWGIARHRHPSRNK